MRLAFINIFLLFIISFSALGQSVDSLLSSRPTQKEQTVESSSDSNQQKLTPPSISELVSVQKIFWTIVFIIFGYIFLNILAKVLNIWAEKSTRYRITIKGSIPIIRILGWCFIIFLIIAAIIHPPMATLLAFSASIGVAVGFASQDILKNVFAGITIIFDRPFHVGDKVEIGEYYGEVVQIGLRSTRLITPDDSLVTVPNGEMMTKSVSNSNSGEANCQVVAEIFLPLDVDMVKARKIAIEAAHVSRYVYLEKPIAVLFFNEMHEHKSFIKMRLKAYVMDIRDEFAFKSDMTELVMKEFIAKNILDTSKM